MTDIDAFARESRGGELDTNSVTDPEPLIWIGGAELAEVKPRRKQMVVDRILPAGALVLNVSKAKTAARFRSRCDGQRRRRPTHRSPKKARRAYGQVEAAAFGDAKTLTMLIDRR